MSSIHHILVTAFIDFLVQVLEAPPAIEVVPELIETFYRFLVVVETAKAGYGLDLAEASLTLEYRAKSLEEVIIHVLDALELPFSGNLALEVFIVWVDGIKLTAAFGVGEHIHCLLYALEERIIVGVADGTGLFVGVMLEDLFAV